MFIIFYSGINIIPTGSGYLLPEICLITLVVYLLTTIRFYK